MIYERVIIELCVIVILYVLSQMGHWSLQFCTKASPPGVTLTLRAASSGDYQVTLSVLYFINSQLIYCSYDLTSSCTNSPSLTSELSRQWKRKMKKPYKEKNKTKDESISERDGCTPSCTHFHLNDLKNKQ